MIELNRHVAVRNFKYVVPVKVWNTEHEINIYGQWVPIVNENAQKDGVIPITVK